VFVGGQVAELLVTDPAAVRVRPTDDVDVVVPVTTRTAYRALQQRLMTLGFMPDTRAGAPVCRMRTADDLILDVMPLDEAILGFSNRWYPYALASATALTLEPGLDVHIASAAAFLAMKWETFASRGAADPMSSHDLEDLITIVAGRAEIVDEVHAAPDEVRHFIHEQTAAFLGAEWAPALLEGNLPDARRVPGLMDAVLRRFQQLTAGG
jgi:predicted nucleotidyltransferase